MIKQIFIIFVLILQVSCATTSGVNPDSLGKVVNKTEFTLNNDVKGMMVITNGFGSKSSRLSGLKKGRYVSKYEDENGIFYEGPANCLIQNKSSGGIYLPKKGTEAKPSFWFYIKGMPQSERNKAGLIVAIGDSWEEGRVKKDWWTTISSELLGAIKITRTTK